MVLTDRQREDLHAGIYEYLKSRGEEFAEAAGAFAAADPGATKEINSVGKTPLLEKKWTAIPRLQKKVLELERVVAQNAKIHAHRTGTENGTPGVYRRMLPRLPCTHTLQGHTASVTCVRVHPVFTVVVSGSEDGTIKVREMSYAEEDTKSFCIRLTTALPHFRAGIALHHLRPCRFGITKVANI